MKNDSEILKEIVQRITSIENPKAIYLFGSYVRKEQTSNSDIDLLIEVDTTANMSERYTKFRRLLRGLKKPFDLLIYNSQEIAEKKKDKYSIVSKALIEGIKLYG